MKSKITVALALCLIGISQSRLAHAEEIQAGDIGSKVIIIGRLERPLGTVVTIDGQMVTVPKRGKSGQVTAAFRVNEVDGKLFKRSLIIGLIFRPSAGVPAFHIQDMVHLSGYETAAFIGTPDSARNILGSDASPFDWKFETTIHVIKSEVATVPKS